MKKTKYTGLLAAVLLAVGLSQPAMGETILLDLGSDGTWRGASVTSPDVNGNNWNSVGYDYVADLVDIDGNVTAVDYAPNGIGGTDSYNGPAGDTAAHPATIGNTAINAAALGNLGVTEAAYDFFVDGAIQIQGLDNTKTYNLTLFGSHKYDTPGVSTYEIHNNADYTNVVASTTLAHNQHLENGWAWEHNQDEVATITGVAPQESDILYLKYTGYLNSLQIVAVPEPATMGLFGVFGATMFFLRRKGRI